MPPDELPFYTFLPWARQGIAARIEQADNLGLDLTAGPKGRATLTASLELEALPVPGAQAPAPSTVSKTVQLVGPGDVGAFKADAVLRTYPKAGALNATPGELAFVEFYEEDFPWRYTPAHAVGHQLRPWLALLVLGDDEYSLLRPPGLLPILELTNTALLPPVDETWAWAHVQVATPLDDVGHLNQVVTDAPDHALSRLLSPRRLRAGAAYHAFVVPAFETGRRAALGQPWSDVPAQQPSWGVGANQPFPVIFEWRFAAGITGDFEPLARALVPRRVGDSFGKRPLDLSQPGYGLDGRLPATTELEGALCPLNLARTDYPQSPGATAESALEGNVDLNEDYRDPILAAAVGDDPIVAPPAYGRRHAGFARVADVTDTGDYGWLRELNLDPRSRCAAGLGADLVRSRDEEFMERAWTQVAALRDVNQRLREAELALSASERLFEKHIERAGDDDRVLVLTAAVQSGLARSGTTSVRGEVDASRVPAAAQAPAFRRITRPQRPLMRRLAGGTVDAFQQGLIGRLNLDPGDDDAASTAPPQPEPPASVAVEDVTQSVDAAVGNLAQEPPKPRRLFLELARDYLAQQRRQGVDLAAIDDGTLKRDLPPLLDAQIPADPNAPADDPQQLLRKGVVELIGAIKEVRKDDADDATILLEAAVFTKHFGHGVEAKAYRGVTVAPFGAAPTVAASATDPNSAAAFQTALAGFTTDEIQGRPVPPPADPLEASSTLAGAVLTQLRPRAALGARLNTVLPGIQDELQAQAQAPRALRPVMAYPVFRDPLFELLRELSQDYILPNVADLPTDTIVLMEPNGRFIESVMAGVNHEFARELLWREFPTDQRGTSFRVFWGTRDALAAPARNDILEMHLWRGRLGSQSPSVSGLLVLVVRGRLLEKFPKTHVFAQKAAFDPQNTSGPRVLDPAGEVRDPVLHGHLDPDIEIYGFDLDPNEARGNSIAPAGWFFVFMERPGQPRFGLDSDGVVPVLDSWDALHWDHLQPADAEQVLVKTNAGLAPQPDPGSPAWGATAADMASILFQSPVLLARHAAEMLPTSTSPLI